MLIRPSYGEQRRWDDGPRDSRDDAEEREVEQSLPARDERWTGNHGLHDSTELFKCLKCLPAKLLQEPSGRQWQRADGEVRGRLVVNDTPV